MANKISVDTTEIMALKSNLKTNIGSIIKNHKSKKQSIYSRMQQVMNEYSDCYEIYSQASAIIALLDEADTASKRIEPLYEQLISGLEYTITSTKQCERDIKKLLGIEKPEIDNIRDRNTRTVRSRGLNKDSNLIEEAIEAEGQEEDIETWGKEEVKDIEEDSLLFGRKAIESSSQKLEVAKEELENVKAPKSLSEMSFQKEGTSSEINLSSNGYAEAIEKKRLDKISTYTSLLNQSVKEGKEEPQWLLDALAAIGFLGGELLEKVADEIEAKKKQEEERLKAIQNYADLLNEYRRTGRGEPQWLLDKLEELGAPYGVIDWQTVASTINGVTIPSVQATQNLSSESCDKYIKTLLEDLNGTIEDPWGISALNFEGDINDKEVYELAVMQYLEARDLDIAYELLGEQDESKRDQILLYWLLAETKGKNLKEEPMPDWWLQESKKALENLEVLEEDFKNSKVAAFDYYFKYQYMVDIVQNDGTPIICDHFFEKWFDEQYGHLDPDSYEVKRLKYLISQDLKVDLCSQDGPYDNVETYEYLNAKKLWMHLTNTYNKYYTSLTWFKSLDKFFEEIIDKFQGNISETFIRDEDKEMLILNGDYRQTTDFITNLNELYGYDVQVNNDNTITISILMSNGENPNSVQDKINMGQEVTRNTYTLEVETFEYAGEIYVNSAQFNRAFLEYMVTRIADNSYFNDTQGYDDAYTKNRAMEIYQREILDNPNASYDKIYGTLRAQAELDYINKERKPTTEYAQDGVQFVVDGAAIAAAIAGHPWVSAMLEGSNIGIAAVRDREDEAYLRLTGLLLGGMFGYSQYAKVGKEFTEASAKELTSLSASQIKTITREADTIKVVLSNGEEIICSSADLYMDDMVKLVKLEKLTTVKQKILSGKAVTVQDLINAGVKTIDNLNEIGIKNVDDIVALGIKKSKDLRQLGITTVGDLKQLGVGSVDDLFKLDIKNLNILKNFGAKTADDLVELGICSAEDLVKLGVTNPKMLSGFVKTPDDLVKLGLNNMTNLRKVGIVSSDDITNKLGLQFNKEMIEKLGIKIADNDEMLKVLQSNDRVTIIGVDKNLEAPIVNKAYEFKDILQELKIEEGNSAILDMDIEELQGIYGASSQVDVPINNKSIEIIGEPATIYYDASWAELSNGKYLDRKFCTEYKLINHLEELLNNKGNATGTITLYTEKIPCGSCSELLNEFLENHANIKLEIIYGNL